MSSAMSVIYIGFGLLFLYGLGVFALCLQAGENPISSAIEASGWWAAFSISHIVGYLAITLH